MIASTHTKFALRHGKPGVPEPSSPARSDEDRAKAKGWKRRRDVIASGDIEQVLRLAPDGNDRLRRFAMVLAALVIMCLIMAAVVWWRLLAR